MKVFILLLCLAAVCEARMRPVDLKASVVEDFLRGLLEGLNDQGDIGKLLECVNGAEAIINDIIAALKLIATGNIMKVIEGVGKLVESAKKLMDILKPCTDGFEQLKKLMSALRDINIQKLIAKLLLNLGAYITNVKACIKAFEDRDFRNAGKYLGMIFYDLFLSELQEPRTMSFYEIVWIIKRFVNALNKDGQIENIENCVNSVPIITEDIIDILNAFRNINWKNLAEIVAAFNHIVEAFKDLLSAVLPCSKLPGDFVKLFKIFLKTTGSGLIHKVIGKRPDIVSSVDKIILSLGDDDYAGMSYEFGKIIFLLFIEDVNP